MKKCIISIIVGIVLCVVQRVTGWGGSFIDAVVPYIIPALVVIGLPVHIVRGRRRIYGHKQPWGSV